MAYLFEERVESPKRAVQGEDSSTRTTKRNNHTNKPNPIDGGGERPSVNYYCSLGGREGHDSPLGRCSISVIRFLIRMIPVQSRSLPVRFPVWSLWNYNYYRNNFMFMTSCLLYRKWEKDESDNLNISE